MSGLLPAGATTYLLSKLNTSPPQQQHSIQLLPEVASSLAKIPGRWLFMCIRCSRGDECREQYFNIPHASSFRTNYLINPGVYGVHTQVWENTLFRLCSIQFRHKKHWFESNTSSTVQTTHIPHSPPFISRPPWPALRGVVKHGSRVSRLYLLHPAWLYHFQVNNALQTGHVAPLPYSANDLEKWYIHPVACNRKV